MNIDKFWWPLLLAGLLTVACVPHAQPPADPWQALRQADGSVHWLGEYRFVPPPPPWQVIDLNDNDLSLVLYRACASSEPGGPCESTMAYAEEPFGYSRALEPRAREFLKRYLWAAQVTFSDPALIPATINGREALVMLVSGKQPVKGHRLQAKIVFMHRGERVVAFFCNQWRTADTPFSEDDFSDFDRFVASFAFLQPSFYETL